MILVDFNYRNDCISQFHVRGHTHSIGCQSLSLVAVMTAEAGERGPNVDARDNWARQMRLKFSPAGMSDENGDIIQAFFKPVGLPVFWEGWGAAEQEALLKVTGEG